MSSGKPRLDSREELGAISVVMPTYNRRKQLMEALGSATQQTYPAQEIIVVNDASTDDTAEVVSKIDNPVLRLISHQENRGVSAALNTGIQAARGEFIAFLEDDDVWLPDKLARQIPLFRNPDVGLVYSGVAMVDEEDNVIRQAVPTKRGDIYQELLFKPHISTVSCVVVRRQCFDQAGLFDESLHGPQDHDMWIRIARHYEVDYAPEALVQYAAYQHGPRLNSPSKVLPMYDRLNAKFKTYDYPSPLLRRRVLAYRRYTLAGVYGVSGDTASARREHLRSLATWPFNVKNWLGLAATLGGPATYRRLTDLKSQALNLLNRRRAR